MTSQRLEPIPAPYRGGARSGPNGSALPAEGFVGEMIAQFSDPYECLRELVQNAVDARAQSITVQLVSESNHMRLTVRDDGIGMTRRTIEDELTVLFRSSKQPGQDTIGRFGIGFVSVFALSPELVEVDTSTGDGPIWTMHMHPDRQYDLYQSAGRPGVHGTRISLILRVDPASHGELVERSQRTLSRWCKHIRIPLRFVYFPNEYSGPVVDECLNEEFHLPTAILARSSASASGDIRAVVGLPKNERPYGAFLGHGLLIHETTDHGLGHVVFKVDSTQLEHTLSRDGVRRNAAFRRALEVVSRALASLTEHAIERTHQLARAYVAGERGAGDELLELYDALDRAGFVASSLDIALPLWGPRGLFVSTLGAITRRSAYAADANSELVIQLSKHHCIVDLSVARSGAERARYREWLARAAHEPIPLATEAATLIEPAPASPDDCELLASLREMLGRVVRKPSGLIFARLHGANGQALLAPTHRPSEAELLFREDNDSDVFRFLRRPHIALNIEHPLIHAARTRYQSAPSLTAYLIARAILTDRGMLSPAVDLALTEVGMQDALENVR